MQQIQLPSRSSVPLNNTDREREENKFAKTQTSNKEVMVYIYIYIYIVQLNGDSNLVKPS